MKGKNSDGEPDFIPYDDENLAHVRCGPDYGQPDSSSNAWTELNSPEYPEYVSALSSEILKTLCSFKKMYKYIMYSSIFTFSLMYLVF